MKNWILKLFLGTILLIGVTGCTNDTVMKINSIEMNECNYKPKLFTSISGSNIYTYCLNEVKVVLENRELDLQKYIEKREDAINKIIEILELENTLYDGGTKVYKGNDITLIKCNTLAGNKDIYIGNKEMKYKENFCKKNNDTFVKTYEIKDIQEYNEQQYENGIPVYNAFSFKVKIRNNQIEEEVIINQYVELEKGKTYEFEFMFHDDVKNIEDTPKNIFENSIIVEIREIDKISVNQIQEEVK